MSVSLIYIPESSIVIVSELGEITSRGSLPRSTIENFSLGNASHSLSLMMKIRKQFRVLLLLKWRSVLIG